MKLNAPTKGILLLCYISLLSYPSPSVLGQHRILDVNEGFERESFILPYAFYSERVDFALGLVGGIAGRPQEQMGLVGTAYGSTNSSWALHLIGRDIRAPFCERLFLDPRFSMEQPKNMVVYTDGSPEFPLERAGSNNSHKNNFLDGRGNDYFIHLKFKYLFPIGHGRDNIINEYVVRDGFLTSRQTGGDLWNPFENGRTYLQVEPFYRRQSVENDFTKNAVNTNGMKFSVIYDNTDFQINPSKGSSQKVAISRDFGLFDSSDPWTVIEGQFSKYLSLGQAKGIRQQVLAFNCWTAETPTWKKAGVDENGKTIFRRPPIYAGATLGGVNRFRGYREQRFSDKAAIYYTLEYRVIPDWNPFESGIWQRFEIEWIQGVLFTEVGRVAEKWTLKELHSDMKWDVGVGLRIWAKNLIVRLDTAFSEEGGRILLWAGHPF
jgi:hypothetical protein